MPDADIFTLLGPTWLTIIDIGIIVGLITFAIIGIVFDVRDWKQRRK